MHKMHIELFETLNIDRGYPLRHTIQAGLLVPPSVVITPVNNGLFYESEGDMILFSPLFTRKVGGQTCQLELALEKVQLTIGNCDLIDRCKSRITCSVP